MIGIIYGTTGELIKLAPVLRALDEEGIPYITACTGQQPEQIPPLLDQFGLRQPDAWLARGHRGEDLRRNTEIPGWAVRVMITFAVRRGRLRRQLTVDGRPLVMVHGDTLTTLLGALMGKILRLPLAHVEAGYRSGSWRTPFPEEVVRRMVSRLARIHYASGPHTAENLYRERTKGVVVDTGFNTIRDSMDLVATTPPSVAVPDEPFGLVSIHRFELLNNDAALRGTMDELRNSTREGLPLLFVDHPVTARAVDAAGFADRFDGDRFRRIPRQSYFSFITLMRRSSFLVTDSGGSQQECWQSGHPCLVHREVTEHTDSVGGSVVVSALDLSVLRAFLNGGWRSHVTEGSERPSPTAIIMAHLHELGFGGRGNKRGSTSHPAD